MVWSYEGGGFLRIVASWVSLGLGGSMFVLIVVWVRRRSKKEQLRRYEGLIPEHQGQNMALTVLFVLSSPESGVGIAAFGTGGVVWSYQEGGFLRSVASWVSWGFVKDISFRNAYNLQT